MEKHKGAWLMNVKKTPNYDNLSTNEQQQIDEQLTQMIRAKYVDINYNGLNENVIKRLTEDYTINPFDHTTVVIDEAHNLVRGITNQIKSPKSIFSRIYDYLMNAVNVLI